MSKKNAAATKPAEKRQAGRPCGYTPEVAAAICVKLAEGMSLRAICEADDMPAASTVFKWLAEQPGFSEQYARAREEQAEFYASQILEIADDERHDWQLTKKGVITDEVAIGRARLQIDARKWLASKLAPKKYGEKVAIGGADDLPPVKSQVYALSNEELVAIARGKGQ